MRDIRDIKSFRKGLNLDTSIENQPENTYRFALNMINRTNEGDLFNLSNEEANSLCFKLPQDYTYIGSVRINDSKKVIFSVNTKKNISEIGIVDLDCNYKVVVNDFNSVDKLNFKINKPITAIYRLRRGCGNTIYWIDDYNPPRTLNLDKLENFKTAGLWDADKFKLQRTIKSIPIFTELEVLNNNGFLNPGSVQIAIRQLDNDFNPTEWSIVSNPLNIYNDSLTNDFLDIRGSIKSVEDYYNFPETTKSIKIEVDNLDHDFPFYQLAFIHRNSGNGFVSEIFVSSKLNVDNKSFIYTGKNYETKITEEEILAFNNIIGSANSIEQLDNRLLLGGIKGKKVKLCKLQKFASKIKTDLYVKEVYLNTLDDKNSPKSPEVQLNGVGYMPGEIYSLGIIYIFKDGTLSPAFHIPGKSNDIVDINGNNISENIVFSPGNNTYPMALNNTSQNQKYIDTSKCMNYWGYDSQGKELKNKNVRHHRFPYREDIGVPFVEKVPLSNNHINSFVLKIEGEGNLDLSCQNNNTCDIFKIKITYEIDGIQETIYRTYNKANLTNPFNFTIYSNAHSSQNFQNVNVTTVDSNDNSTNDINNITINNNGDGEVVNNSFQTEQNLYKGYVYGLKFSNIEIPNIENEYIIGYYIVRQERNEKNKTILDSAILTPTVKYKKNISKKTDSSFGVDIDTHNSSVDDNNNIYISSGLLAPNLNYSDLEIKAGMNKSYSYHNTAYNKSRLSKQIFGLIYPEHKFREKEYQNFKLTHHGQFDIVKQSHSQFRYNDVMDGSSYDEEHHSSDSKDKDGWSLRCITRDSKLSFRQYIDNKYSLNEENIKEVFYLDPLNNKIKSVNDKKLDIYNNTPDNKIGIVYTKEEVDDRLENKYPYVYLEKSMEDYYPNFRLQPYYKITSNFETSDTVIVFGGDTYITPMRYANTIHWNNRVAYRAPKTHWWKYLLALVAVVILGPTLLGFGIAALLISSGLKDEKWQKAYNEEYEKGLRGTALDKFSSREYKYTKYANSSPKGFSVISPQDDEIQWIGDVLTNIWFESQINTILRVGMVDNQKEYFLDAPDELEFSHNFSKDDTTYVEVGSLLGIDFNASNNLRILDDITILPETKVDRYFAQKLTIFDADRKDLKKYTVPVPELYKINEDYQAMNKAKIYHHLPIEYDCCSNCIEKFPTRVHYSEQSFQEELQDNYRVFLPNNYRDVQGETGAITNLFSLKNNLYIHTEDALWHLPQTFQERITGEIVSFLGTGSYFSTPPRKIVDSENKSAGCLHSIATNKTKYGIFFISEKDKTVYLFDGNQLKNLNDKGISSWLNNNIPLQFKREFYHLTGENYQFDNNPTNKNGIGFISVYDSTKRRFIFTKKDFTFNKDFRIGENDKIIFCDDKIILFEDYYLIIEEKESQGWIFKGIKDCKMYFERDIQNSGTETVTTLSKISNETDIHIFYDTSGSFDKYIEGSRLMNNNDDLGPTLGSIDDAVNDWIANFQSNNPDWNGTIYKYIDSSERWLKFPNLILNTYSGQNTANKDILAISFINESQGLHGYHDNDLLNTIQNPTQYYLDDYDHFTGNNINGNNSGNYSVYNQFRNFNGIMYPVVFSDMDATKVLVQMSLAALKGVPYNQNEVDNLSRNDGFTNSEWNKLKDSLIGNNPYPDDSLDNYGWLLKEDRYKHSNGTVIDSVQFQEDIQDLLLGTIIEQQVQIPTTIHNIEKFYNEGLLINSLFDSNNSFTLSYSLETDSWISWHSYLPEVYIKDENTFFSSEKGNKFWKHNIIGRYNQFYGIKKDVIIDYVHDKSMIDTKVFDYVNFYTRAEKWDNIKKYFIEDRFTTFNKIILYNSRQSSGLMMLVPKDKMNSENYLLNQVSNNNDIILLNKDEKNWSFNDLRDIRINYDEPIFISNIDSLQNDYYIDKILNVSSLNYNKDWTQLERFRDKYLAVRLIFNTFVDRKLTFHYSIDSEEVTNR